MYRKICVQASSLLTVFDDLILNLRDEEGPQKHWLSELSLDGAVLSESPIPDEHLRTIGLECGQCMVEYGSGGESSLICFSPAGESLVSIEGLGGYPEVIPRGGTRVLPAGGATRPLRQPDPAARGPGVCPVGSPHLPGRMRGVPPPHGGLADPAPRPAGSGGAWAGGGLAARPVRERPACWLEGPRARQGQLAQPLRG